MNRHFKNTIAALAFATLSPLASAIPINVGGVVWDPENAFDFVTQGNQYQYVVNQNQTELRGYGRITQLDDSAAVADFCPGCQLTYTFGGYTLVESAQSRLRFTGGWVNFWVQRTTDNGYTGFDATKPETAGDGALWLALSGHAEERFIDGASLGLGTLFGRVEGAGTSSERSQYGGLLDVVGGTAAKNIDTNDIVDSFGNFADINFTSTVLLTQKKAVQAGAADLSGNGTFTGTSIPEPTSVLLFGLGLIAFLLGNRSGKTKS